MALVLDTGPLLAGLDAADPDHDRCADLIGSADEDLLIPVLVLAELEYWCSRRLALDAWLVFAEDLLDGVYRLEEFTHADLTRALEIQRDYDDMAVGVVDASILALVERLEETKLATLDHRHFGTMTPAHLDSIELLPA